MMFARIDQRPVARWWWTVDRWTLGALVALIFFGTIVSMAASPAVAERLGYASLHFTERQLATVPFALAIMFGVSLLPPRSVRRTAFIVFAVSFVLLVLTFLIGAEIKGARRWINLPGFSLQPSEFVKPSFAIVAAWLFTEQKENPGFPGNAISIALFLVLTAMLVKQPDLGMAVVVAAVWFAQFFMAGLRPARSRDWPGLSAPICGCRTSPAASTAFSTPRRATVIRSTGRWRPSSMAGCGDAVPARAGSRTYCPTPTPISCSPSPVRNSAPSFAS
jgi:hypothetical protein